MCAWCLGVWDNARLGRFSGTSMEPPLPRRKKCPELAYRTHEFISSAAQQHANIQAADGGGLVGGGGGGGGGGGIDALDSNVVADKVRVSPVTCV